MRTKFTVHATYGHKEGNKGLEKEDDVFKDDNEAQTGSEQLVVVGRVVSGAIAVAFVVAVEVARRGLCRAVERRECKLVLNVACTTIAIQSLKNIYKNS